MNKYQHYIDVRGETANYKLKVCLNFTSFNYFMMIIKTEFLVYTNCKTSQYRRLFFRINDSETFLKWPIKQKTIICFKTNCCQMQCRSKILQNDPLCRSKVLQNAPRGILQYFCAGQKLCRMLQGEHSAILLTFIKIPFVIKNFVNF